MGWSSILFLFGGRGLVWLSVLFGAATVPDVHCDCRFQCGDIFGSHTKERRMVHMGIAIILQTGVFY